MERQDLNLMEFEDAGNLTGLQGPKEQLGRGEEVVAAGITIQMASSQRHVGSFGPPGRGDGNRDGNWRGQGARGDVVVEGQM